MLYRFTVTVKNLHAFENAHGACLQLWISTYLVEFVLQYSIAMERIDSLYQIFLKRSLHERSCPQQRHELAIDNRQSQQYDWCLNGIRGD